MENVILSWIVAIILLFIGFVIGRIVNKIENSGTFGDPEIDFGNIDFSIISDEDKTKLNRDIEIISSIITQICDYAVNNGIEPNDTLKRISSNILFIGEISDFNDWGKITETKN